MKKPIQVFYYLIFTSLLACGGQELDKKETSISDNQNNPEEILKQIGSWPEACQEVTKAMFQKHGAPDVISDDRLVWINKGKFREIIVHREVLEHHFPMEHTDVLQHVVNYVVTENKYNELALFNGSLSIEKTRGTMSSRCANEYLNHLVLNIAHEIASGERNVEEAKDFMVTNVIAAMMGDTSLFMHDLLFEVSENSGNKGELVIDKKVLEEIQEAYQ